MKRNSNRVGYISTTKMLLIFLVVSIIILLVSSCAQVASNGEETNNNKVIDKNFTVLEINGFDYGVFPGVNHSAEFSYDYKKVEEYEDKTIMLTFDGVEYDAQYKYSIVDYFIADYDYEIYEAKKDGKVVLFQINKSKNTIDRVRVSRDDKYLDNPLLEEKTKDQCIEISRQFLSDYVKDVSLYSIEDVSVLKIDSYGECYDITFLRKEGNIYYYDLATVSITKYGDIYGYKFESFGDMENSKPPDNDTLKQIEESVKAKLDEMYKDYKGDNLNYELINMYFGHFKNGKYGLEYRYKITQTDTDNQNVSKQENVSFVVFLD